MSLQARMGTKSESLSFKFDLKTLGDAEFEGYGSTFGNVDLGEDIVLPGAFKSTLKKHKADGKLPQMFWMHQPDQVPGKWLEMSEDSTGLYVKGMLLTSTQLGRETHDLLKAEAIRGLSIGFSIKNYKTDVSFDEDGHRLLKQIDLWEVSLVSLPMNPEANVEAVKLKQIAELKQVAEEKLRDVIPDLSHKEAKTAIAVCTSLFTQFKLTDQVLRDVETNTAMVDVDETAAVEESVETLFDNVRASILR